MRLLVICLLSILVFFQYQLWIGDNGYLDYRTAKRLVSEKTIENANLEQRNRLIKAEIKDLKEGFDAVEERARMEHEMVKTNEVFYRIMDEKEYQ